MAKSVGCIDAGDLKCLTQVNAGQLSQAFASTASFRAVLDGDVYEDLPLAIIKKGNFNRVPLIIGNNAGEGGLFVYPTDKPTRPATADELRCVYSRTFGEDSEQIEEMYPPVDGIGVDNRQ